MSMIQFLFVRTICVSLALVLTGCSHRIAGDNKVVDRMDVLPAMVCSVRPKSTNEFQLRVSLRYEGSTNLTFFPEVLPWYKGQMTLYAVDANQRPGSLLQQEPLPAGAMWFGKARTLVPGQVLEGEIPLNEWFPELQRAVARADVLVFWSYKPPPNVPLVLERQSGVVVIPRRE